MKEILPIVFAVLFISSCNLSPTSIFSSSSISEDLSSPIVDSSTSNGDYKDDTSVIKEDGYYIRNMRYASKEYNPRYSPSIGQVKTLLIPIHLYGKTSYNWTNNKLNNIKTSMNDFKSYYDNASYGLLDNEVTVVGSINDMYNAKEEYTEAYFKSDDEEENFKRLYEMFDDIIDYLISRNDISLSDYDSDSDGLIDSIHFIVDGSDDDIWASSLWPHMSDTLKENGTIDRPNVGVYSLSNLGHFSDATTMIHEQGHIYGLEDYYDYSYSGVNFVGNSDMQSNDKLDWNVFSKLSMGWLKPYIIDGTKDEISISIRPASLYGDAILIPSSTYNDTPYDEYILLELFSNYGNNQKDWVNSVYGEGGIRLYHVDARLYGYNDEDLLEDETGDTYGTLIGGEFIDDIYSNPYSNYQLAFSNSLNNSYEYPEILEYGDKYHLLHLIQASNENTFEKNTGRSYAQLTNKDLFKTGDTFTIGQYNGFTDYGKNFFKNKTTFNNGENFPYLISFDKIEKDLATITIKKK